MMFQDRSEAGRVLAEKIIALNVDGGVVLALPRGGVPVGYEVARRCEMPLDVLVVRKLGVPSQPELAVGAVASGGTQVVNEDVVHELAICEEILDAAADREMQEVIRQERQFRAGRPPVEVAGRTAILVDDGLATGASMRAAVMAIRARSPRIVVAVPVGAADICSGLRNEADVVVCAMMPEPLGAVGRFYRDFHPVTDDEVRNLLEQANREYELRHAA